MYPRQELLKARCIIPVGRTFAVVDPSDYDRLIKWDWKLKRRGNGSLYASLNYKDADGFRVVYMHHTVCVVHHGSRPGLDYACEAIDGDSLNCIPSNLRWRPKLELKMAAMARGLAAKRAAANA